MRSVSREELIEKMPQEYHEFVDKLLEKRDQIVDEIKNMSASSLTSDRQAGEELADIGGDNFMREVELSLVGEEEKIYYLIEEALERIQEGTYGVCCDCGEKIAKGRLDAIPYAKLCVECKQEREKNEGLPPRQDEAEVEKIVE